MQAAPSCETAGDAVVMPRRGASVHITNTDRLDLEGRAIREGEGWEGGRGEWPPVRP